MATFTVELPDVSPEDAPESLFRIVMKEAMASYVSEINRAVHSVKMDPGGAVADRLFLATKLKNAFVKARETVT